MPFFYFKKVTELPLRRGNGQKMMKILITGAKGFVGKNLTETLSNIRDGKDRNRDIPADLQLYEYDIDTPPEKLEEYCRDCDFVFHLAGVNRPKEEAEYMQGNFGFTSVLLETLRHCQNRCPIMLSSSIQAALDNPYGKSKRAGEELLEHYGEENGVKTLIYRFPNVFGKWCRPNYNSAVATFCNNIACGLPITVNDRNTQLTLVYIDDVVEELLAALVGKETRENGFCKVPVSYRVSLGEIVDLLYEFNESRTNKMIPTMSGFSKKLYSTYLSYLPKNEFAYETKMNCDERGSFTELFKTAERGQVSVNISKPGITKGNHWHHSKNEKFVVVSGRGVIRFRKPDSEEILEYFVSGDSLQIVDIPTGYTHNIENLGDCDMVTIMWCNECFQPEKPDTYFLEV